MPHSGCGLAVGTVLETVAPGGPTFVAFTADVGVALLNAVNPVSIRLPVRLYELGLGAITEIGRLYTGYHIWQTSGDAALGALVYLGLGAAHSALVGYRIFDRVIRNNG